MNSTNLKRWLPKHSPEQIRAAKAEQAKQHLANFVRFISPELIPAKHHQVLIEKLEAVERGDIKRLMVFMPPNHAKSTYASTFFSAWWVGRNPQKCIIAASYGDELASSFGRRVRNLVASDEYRDVFGFNLADDSKAADRWSVAPPNKRLGTPSGEYKAAGVGSGITGRRADLALIDDPVKGREEADSAITRERVWQWYLSDFRTRLNPGGAIIIIQTRWHEDDLSGRILGSQYDGRSGWYTTASGEEWYVLSLQAIAEREDDPLGRQLGEALWPQWMSCDALAKEKLAQGIRNWESLYQQRPRPLEGALFKPEKIQIIDVLPAGLRYIRAWDLAATAQVGTNNPDWTVGAKLGIDKEGRIYIVDIVRLRGTPNEVEMVLLATASQDGRSVRISLPQDPGQAGKAQAQYLIRKLSGYTVSATPESGAKETRAAPLASQVEAGNVFMLRANWNQALIEEMRAFPNGAKDDQVDALARAFLGVQQSTTPSKSAWIFHMAR